MSKVLVTYPIVANLNVAGIGEQMVMGLQDASSTLQDKVQSSQLRLFNQSNPLMASQVKFQDSSDDEEDLKNFQDHDDDDDQENENDSDLSSSDSEEEEDGDIQPDEQGRKRRKVRKAIRVAPNAAADSDNDGVEFADSDSDFGNDSDFSDHDGEQDDGTDVEEDQDPVSIAADGTLRWKDSLADDAAARFSKSRRLNLMELVYNSEYMPTIMEESSGNEEEEGGLFTVKKKKKQMKSLALVDTCKFEVPMADIEKWDNESVFHLSTLQSHFDRKWKRLPSSLSLERKRKKKRNKWMKKAILKILKRLVKKKSQIVKRKKT